MIDKTCPILYDRDTNFIQAMSVPAPAGENREPGERPGRYRRCMRGCCLHKMSHWETGKAAQAGGEA